MLKNLFDSNREPEFVHINMTHNRTETETRLLENNNLFAIMKVQKQCNVMSI